MEKLVILDYGTGDIDIYPIQHLEDPESVIEDLGHKIDDCHWMVSPGNITFHKEMLK